METNRRRGQSFHESEDLQNSSSGSGSSSNEMQFITPQFDANFDMKETLSLDPSQLIFDDDKSGGLEEEEEEEDRTRGRSRSRSVHQYDGSPNSTVIHLIDPQQLMESGGNNNVVNTSSSPDHKAAGSTPAEKVERSGPLQSKEILALKKGLEEASHVRNSYQLREEEDERRAAESERKQRATVTPTSMGADPHMRRIKILILGDSGVGKSSLINRWTSDQFTASLVGTVGVNFKTKKVQLDGEYIQVQVWDTAGQEQFHKITTSYYKGANGIMLVYDVSDKETMDNIEYWVKNIKSHATDTVQVVLVGNKTDLRTAANMDKCCETEICRNTAAKYSVPYFETSAKDASHVDDAFVTLVKKIIAADPNAGGATKAGPKVPVARARPSLVERAQEKVGVFSSFTNQKLSMFNSSSISSTPPTSPSQGSGSSSSSSSSIDKEKCVIS